MLPCWRRVWETLGLPRCTVLSSWCLLRLFRYEKSGLFVEKYFLLVFAFFCFFFLTSVSLLRTQSVLQFLLLVFLFYFCPWSFAVCERFASHFLCVSRVRDILLYYFDIVYFVCIVFVFLASFWCLIIRCNVALF